MSIKSRQWLAVVIAGSFLGVAQAAEQGGATAEQKKPSTGAFCGGIAAIACPEGLTCVDNPQDTCDPNTGGADCGGICMSTDAKQKKPKKNRCDYSNPTQHFVSKSPDECAAIHFLCEEGSRPFFSSCGCGCQPGA